MPQIVLKIAAVLLCTVLALTSPAGAKEAQIDRIVVEKAARTLTLWTRGQAVKNYRVALGVDPLGDKVQQGDGRTPEGAYFIDAKNAKSQFHKSLHISYPDKNDMAAAARRGVSPGGAIMIHGTPEYIQKLYAIGVYPDWTAGCIAVSNKDIDEIFSLVPIGTPIEIKP